MPDLHPEVLKMIEAGPLAVEVDYDTGKVKEREHPQEFARRIAALQQEISERENAALRAELEGVRKDAERLNGLLKLPVVQAQAILWNYASAKNRKSAIDAAIFEAGSPKVRNEWAKANEAAERLAPRDLLRLLAGWCR